MLARGQCCAATGQAGGISRIAYDKHCSETHGYVVWTPAIERYLTSRVGVSHELSCCCVEATAKARISGALDGDDIANSTDGAGGVRVGVCTVDVRVIAYMTFAIDDCCVQEAMGVDGSYRCEKECAKCGLHLAGSLLLVDK